MAQSEYTETLIVRVTKEQKEFWKKQLPNPSKWLRELITVKMEENKWNK